MKKAFTMIELVFVIVVLGILAAIAVPKFAVSRSDAEIAKGRADVSTIRSAIITERQAQFISGTTTYIPKLSTSTTTLFTGNGTRELLMYGIAAGTTSGHWKSTNVDGKHYSYMVGTSYVAFTYDSSTGKFTCDESKPLCKDLVN